MQSSTLEAVFTFISREGENRIFKHTGRDSVTISEVVNGL